MTTNPKSVLLSISICLFVSASLATPVFAISPPPQAQMRLTEARLKSCQARENSLKTRSSSLTSMATNMLDTFASITKRVEDYYATSGKTVANYDVLVADIQMKKVAVQTSLTAAQNDVAGFSCTSDDPKGHMTLFLKDMKNVKLALNNYRTSVKNLIVAVRRVTAVEAKESLKPSNTPSPSNTPNPRSNSQGNQGRNN